MSIKKIIESGKMPTINFIECQGNLNLKGWGEPMVNLKGEDAEVNEKETGLNVWSKSDLKASIPAASIVDLRQVHGDANVKGVTGPLTVGEINGNLLVKGAESFMAEAVRGDFRLADVAGHATISTVAGDFSAKNVQQLSAESVQGDCSIKSISGDLQVTLVSGEFAARNCGSQVQVEQVLGDAVIQNVDGELNLEMVNGDVLLRGGLNPGKHHITASGDVKISWPEDQSVQFLIEYGGELRNLLPIKNSSDDKKSFSAAIGDGAAIVIVKAGGNVRLKPRADNEDFSFDFDLDLDLDELGETLSSHLESISVRLNETLGPNFANKITSKIEQAMDKAATKLEKAQFTIYRPKGSGYRGRPPHVPAPPKAPEPPTAKKADQAEQLKILEMLEAGSISVEDATMLLKALER